MIGEKAGRICTSYLLMRKTDVCVTVATTGLQIADGKMDYDQILKLIDKSETNLNQLFVSLFRCVEIRCGKSSCSNASSSAFSAIRINSKFVIPLFYHVSVLFASDFVRCRYLNPFALSFVFAFCRRFDGDSVPVCADFLIFISRNEKIFR